MRWDGQSLAEVIKSKQNDRGLAEYSERLLEAETAKEYSIPFDSNWYGLPVKTREVMIAARMGKAWLDNLQGEEEIRKAKSGSK